MLRKVGTNRKGTMGWEGRQVFLLEGKEVALFPKGEGSKRWQTLQKRAATICQQNAGPGVIPSHMDSGLSHVACCHQWGLSTQDTEGTRIIPLGLVLAQVLVALKPA